MDKIELNEQNVVLLDNVAEGLVGLRILFVNLFAIGEPGNWLLVDAGLYLSANRIRAWAERHFGGTAPRAILLTHAHFDHVGSLEELASQWDVPVYVHPLELPYVTGQEKYPPPDPTVGGGLMALMSPFYPRGPIDLSTRALPLPNEGFIPGFIEWQWLHTPGHTRGHISLFRERDRALIVGDAFCTTKQESLLAVAQQKPELHGPPAYYTPDWKAARASVERLAALRPLALAPGHGQPMAGEHVAEALQDMADDFDRIARPDSGRYVA